MNELLNRMFLDNSVRSLLIVAAVILLVFIIKRYLSRYFAGLLFRMISVFTRNVERKEFVNLVVAPLESFLWILTIIISLDKLKFPSVFAFEIYHLTSRDLVDAFAKAVLIITFIWFLLKVIDFVALVLKKKAALTPDTTDDQLIVFFKDFFKAMLVLLGILLVLRFVFNYNISTLITGLSIATAAIALATKESLENLIASFIIFFDKPFFVGDIVKVQSVTGVIERIGLRSTRIRTENKTYVTVPNKQMVDSIVDNHSQRTYRRGELLLEINTEVGPQQLRSFIKALKDLLAKKELNSYLVLLQDLNKNASVVKIEYFSAKIMIDEFNQLKEEINFSVLELMETMNIKLAINNTQVIVTR
jgi:MscS family membrane protein